MASYIASNSHCRGMPRRKPAEFQKNNKNRNPAVKLGWATTNNSATGGAPDLVPSKSASDWKTWVNTFGMGLRQTFLKYRDGARVVAGSRLTDTVYMETSERIGRRLLEAGFSVRPAVVLLSTVYTFTVSFVIEEQAVFPVEREALSSL